MPAHRKTRGLQEFEQWLRHQNLEDRTIRDYLLSVQECAEHYNEAEQKYPLAEITTEEIDDYLLYLQSTGPKVSLHGHEVPWLNGEQCAGKGLWKETRSKKWSGLQKWFRFLKGMGVIDTLPEKSVEITMTRAEARQEKVYLTEDADVQKIRRHLIERQAETPYQIALKYRDIALVETLLNTGCRAGEALSLKWDYIQWRNEERTQGIIKIPTLKTMKIKKELGTNYRSVPFNGRMAYALNEFWDVERIGTPYRIFGGHTTGLNTYETLRGVIQRIADAVDMEWLTPHQFRHYYATYLAKQGVAVTDIANLMGDTVDVVIRNYIHLDSKYSEERLEGMGIEI